MWVVFEIASPTLSHFSLPTQTYINTSKVNNQQRQIAEEKTNAIIFIFIVLSRLYTCKDNVTWS